MVNISDILSSELKNENDFEKKDQVGSMFVNPYYIG